MIAVEILANSKLTYRQELPVYSRRMMDQMVKGFVDNAEVLPAFDPTFLSVHFLQPRRQLEARKAGQLFCLLLHLDAQVRNTSRLLLIPWLPILRKIY